MKGICPPEEHSRFTAQTALAAIITADSKGAIVFWNKRAEDLFGYSAEETIGRAINEILLQCLRNDPQKSLNFEAVPAEFTGIGKTIEAFCCKKNGAEIPVELCLSYWQTGPKTFYTAIVRERVPVAQTPALETGSLIGRKQHIRSPMPAEREMQKVCNSTDSVLSGDGDGMAAADPEEYGSKEIPETSISSSAVGFRILAQSAAEAIIFINSQGRIVFWNNGACRIFGFKNHEVLEKSQKIIIPERFRKKHSRHVLGLHRPGFMDDDAGTYGLRKDGTEFPVEATISSGSAGDEMFHCAIIRDITERKLADNLLRESADRFRAIAETSIDAIILVDKNGDIVFWNQRAQRIFGYEEQEVLGRNIAILIPERYRGDNRKEFIEFQSKGKAETVLDKVMESYGLRKDGAEIPVEISYSRCKTNQGTFYFAALRDITEHKRAVDALRKTQRKLQISKKNFTEFSRQMLSIREEERKNLSMNLHDELGSMAVSLGAKLSVAEDEMKNNNSQGAVEALVQMKAMLKQSVGRIRKISVDLRPPDLDIIGLPDALRNYCKNTTDQTGIAVDCKVDLDGHKISDDTAIVIYRVTQEAFNNIIRHSGAKKAVLELKYRTDNMHFNIQDDGKGFDIKDKLHRTKEAKMGLQGMKERIESLGGTFAITSAPKKGSNISVTLPCFIEEES